MRLLPVALAGAATGICGNALADIQWNPITSSWNTATNWSPQTVPGTGSVADIFKSTATYNINASGIALSAVQVAGGGTILFNSASAGDVLETGSMEIGGTNTGQAGSASATGAGAVSQAAGFVDIDGGGALAVDSVSSYSLSSTGQIISSSSEMLAGSFVQNGGINTVNSGSSITNAGLYTIANASNSAISCDTFINTGTFNQSGSTLQNAAANTSGTFNFSNGGSFTYTLGNFYGVMTNTGIVQVNSASIPFTQGIVNNGLFTINGSTGSFAGAITGGGAGAAMVFKGSTNVTLTGANNYSGSTTVAGGTVILADASGPSLRGNVSIGINATLQCNLSNQIATTSALTSNGTFNLNGFDESVGSLIMNGGAIQQTNKGLGLGVTTGQITINNGSSTINSGLRSANPLNFNVAGTGVVTVSGAMSNYNSTATALVLTGGGAIYFSGASLLSTIDIKNGIMQVSEGGTLGGMNTSVTLESAGSLSLNNQSLSIGDLIGNPGGTVALGSGALTVVSTGSTFPGNITGTGSFTKSGNGTLTLTGVDSATGSTTVTAGAMTVASGATIASSSINTAAQGTFNLNGSLTSIPVISSNGTVNIGQLGGTGISTRTVGGISFGLTGTGEVNVVLATPHIARTLLISSGVTFSGSTNAWSGQLDLSNNDMIIHTGALATIVNQIRSGDQGGTWTGQGITSSAAAADTTHLTALGVVLNDLGGGTPLYGLAGSQGLFDGYNPLATDVLIKYTYFGDSNLDGTVDGTDYSRIDNGFLNNLTGWYNGDFNYDGIVDGSDYTLIDNAFNTQFSNLTTSAQIATSTAQIGGASAVPEPAALGTLAIAGITLLARRGRIA